MYSLIKCAQLSLAIMPVTFYFAYVFLNSTINNKRKVESWLDSVILTTGMYKSSCFFVFLSIHIERSFSSIPELVFDDFKTWFCELISTISCLERVSLFRISIQMSSSWPFFIVKLQLKSAFWQQAKIQTIEHSHSSNDQEKQLNGWFQ